MYEYLINHYWKKFQDYKVKVLLPNGDSYTINFFDMYSQLADRFNLDNSYLNLPMNDTPESIFRKFIDDILLRIIDENYVVGYMIMRVQTFNLYRFYESPKLGNPSFECYDKNNKLIKMIPCNMWRWWVEEMNY